MLTYLNKRLFQTRKPSLWQLTSTIVVATHINCKQFVDFSAYKTLALNKEINRRIRFSLMA